MKYLTNILKTRILIILLAALVVIIGFLYFWGKGKGVSEEKIETVPLPILPRPEIKQEPLAVKPTLSGLKGKFTGFPKELTVYRVDSPEISHDQAIKIASDFGFKEAPQIFHDIKLGSVYNWSSAENYLSIIPNQGSISYGLNLLDNPGLLKGVLASLEEIKTAAISFLERESLPLPQNLKSTIKEAQYLKTSGPIYKPATSPAEADVARIDFEFKIDEIEIIKQPPNTFLLTLKIGPEMKIVNLNYQSPFKNFEVLNSYPLKTEKEVLEAIETMPKISHLQFPYGYLPTKEDYQQIRSIEFTNVELGYYQPSLPESYLQPVFLISGSVELQGGQTGEAFLYLPAIEEEYFTPEL